MKKFTSALAVSSGVFATTAFVLALAFFAYAPKAHAESPNILVGQNMAVGSSGQGVVVLQSLLSELGYLKVPAGIPFGYYGSLTANAVGRYQADLNVYPTAGSYGPLTKIAMYSNLANHNWLTPLGWNE
jgi:peptidoglycan hydrolase-like protein with peptidoglycan-binding domain